MKSGCINGQFVGQVLTGEDWPHVQPLLLKRHHLLQVLQRKAKPTLHLLHPLLDRSTHEGARLQLVDALQIFLYLNLCILNITQYRHMLCLLYYLIIIVLRDFHTETLHLKSQIYELLLNHELHLKTEPHLLHCFFLVQDVEGELFISYHL